MELDLADNEALGMAAARGTLGSGIKPPLLGTGVTPRWRRSAARRRGKPPLRPHSDANSSRAGLTKGFLLHALGDKARYGGAT
jgi:hypothetical protein